HGAYRRGGWAAVNDLWKNSPVSTELFLHPEKLQSAKRDEPVAVEVPDISAALGPGYAPACENTLGEFETEMMLEATLPSLGPASPAGERHDAPADTSDPGRTPAATSENEPSAARAKSTRGSGPAPQDTAT